MPERLPRFLPVISQLEQRFKQTGFERVEAESDEVPTLSEDTAFQPIAIPDKLFGQQLIAWAEQQGAALNFKDAEFLQQRPRLLDRPDCKNRTIYFLGTQWRRQGVAYCLVLRSSNGGKSWSYRFDPLGGSNMRNCVVLKIEQPAQLD
jgi:hypothetical protein